MLAESKGESFVYKLPQGNSSHHRIGSQNDDVNSLVTVGSQIWAEDNEIN